ncbi:ectonucleotide pyrophosphatase/phosphodiesterase [Acidobacteria bacterium AH-259-A15]|nr:ectonucleotide pyrophosphatase/phosphodiesterase [Acidobacteria bacterium AH-259-A15]
MRHVRFPDILRMVRPSWWVAILLVFGTACDASRNQTPADYVILISIDGLRPEFYLDSRWPAPFLRQLAREGIYAAAVRGVFPSVTFPSHTTMITGALPARHGVYYNSPFEPEGQTGRRYWEFSAIRIPTLWDAVRKADRKSAALFWPASVDAPVDWNMPEVSRRDVDVLTAIRRATEPPDFFSEIEQEVTGELTPSDFTNRPTRDQHLASIASYLIRRYRPDLVAIHFRAVDYFQHQFGRDAPEVREAVAGADQAVKRVIETVEAAGIQKRTAIIVAGDHGFVDVHSQLAPNVWLVEAGLMEARDDRGDWRATFHTQAGSAFLHVRDPADSDAVEEVRALLSRLPAHLRAMFRIVEGEELKKSGSDPAVSLALSAPPGITFINAPRMPVIRPTTGGLHGHHPDQPEIHTGFIGWGAGFHSKKAVRLIRLEDLAPIVAELLGLPFEAPDGRVPDDILLSAKSQRNSTPQ